MNLALPPIRVEEAVAAPCEVEEPATADPVRPTHSMRGIVRVEPPPTVEAATIDLMTTTTTHTGPQVPPPSKAISPLSVEGLRMAPGVTHFEGDVAILPRAPGKTMLQIVLPCLYDDRHFVAFGEAKKYCVVKDIICYVYNDPTDPEPLYQISFATTTTTTKYYYTVIMEDRWHPDPTSTTISPEPHTNLPRPEMKTVLLFQVAGTTTTAKSSSTQLLYQFTFDTSSDATVADRFLSILQSIILIAT